MSPSWLWQRAVTYGSDQVCHLKSLKIFGCLHLFLTITSSILNRSYLSVHFVHFCPDNGSDCQLHFTPYWHAASSPDLIFPSAPPALGNCHCVVCLMCLWTLLNPGFCKLRTELFPPINVKSHTTIFSQSQQVPSPAHLLSTLLLYGLLCLSMLPC